MDLSNNKLTQLPETIGNLYSLKKLILNNNPIEKLPETIGNLRNLVELDMSGFSGSELKFIPVSIGNLKSLQIFRIGGYQLLEIPNSIGNLYSLTDLSLTGEFTNLPESIGNLSSLKELNIYANLKSLPLSFRNLSSLEDLHLKNNKLKTFPESLTQLLNLKTLNLESNEIETIHPLISNLKNLVELNLGLNNIISLPDSIGHFKKLERLDLTTNKLKELPDSIGNLTLLEYLTLDNNNISSLPYTFWKLENLRYIELHTNPWTGKWQDVINRDILEIKKFCKKKASINIFISHAVVDYEAYRVKQIAEFFEQNEEIHQAFFCEEDLITEIDKFMDETIPKCHTLIFIATENSIKSQDCKHELKIARDNNIHIIPIKGNSLTWNELEDVDLSRIYGKDFNFDNFNQFCEELLQLILKLKNQIEVIDKEQVEIDLAISEVNDIILEFLESKEYKDFFKKKYIKIKKLIDNYNSLHYSDEFFIKLNKLFKKYQREDRDNGL